MMTWGAEKNEAMKLRINGYSYNEIRNKIGIPKSTLRSWFADLILSKNARERLNARMKTGSLHLIKRNKMQTHRARQKMVQIRSEAAAEFPNVTPRDLLLIGTALYWAEGYKRPKIRGGIERTGHPVSFVNADEEMIRIFMRFLRESLAVEESVIVATMRLYPHINEKAAIVHWIKVTKLPQKAFRKTTHLVSLASKRKKPFNTLPFGTLQIQVMRTEKFHRLMGWIEEMKRKF